MNRFSRHIGILAFALLVIPIGCSAGPDASYVAQNRATYNKIAPTSKAILDGSIPVGTVDVKTFDVAFDDWGTQQAIATPCDYLDKDKATREALLPLKDVVDGKLPLSDIGADERQDYRNALDTWDLRIRGAEAPPGT